MSARNLIEASDAWQRTAESVDGVVMTWTPDRDESVYPYWTNKTFDDGVPCIKYFYRDKISKDFVFESGKPYRIVIDEYGDMFWRHPDGGWMTERGILNVDSFDPDDPDSAEMVDAYEFEYSADRVVKVRLGSSKEWHCVLAEHGKLAVNPMSDAHGFDYEEDAE